MKIEGSVNTFVVDSKSQVAQHQDVRHVLSDEAQRYDMCGEKISGKYLHDEQVFLNNSAKLFTAKQAEPSGNVISASATIEDIIEKLQDENVEVRLEVVRVLGGIARLAIYDAASLVREILQRGGEVSFDEAESISGFAEVLHLINPALSIAMQDPDELVSSGAMDEFSSTTMVIKSEFVAALIGGLESESEYVRHSCAVVLGELPPDLASDAIPCLRQLADSDTSESVRQAASNALLFLTEGSE